MKSVEEKNATVDKKKYIIEVATKLFYENGYDNTSTRELANASGLSVAGIYYFFKNKEEILFTIQYQSIIDLNTIIMTSIDEDEDAEVNLRRIYMNMCRHAIKHSMEIVLLNREGGRLNAKQRKVIFEYRRESYLVLKKQVERIRNVGKLRAGNPSVVALNIFATTSWFPRWFDPDGKMSLEEAVSDLADNFFFGIIGNRES